MSDLRSKLNEFQYYQASELHRKILSGDVLDCLEKIPDSSIDCIISSPPYWGLRNYGVEGQMGLEDDFKDYLKKLQQIMKECKRVLKDVGTCWINLGDTYAGSSHHSDWSSVDDRFKSQQMKKGSFKGKYRNHLQAKSRYGIPERFYIDCIDDGWIARNHIPWVKSNSMPSSVKDRFTNKWESVFFFAKKPNYYFNLDAVREPRINPIQKPFNVRVRDSDKDKFLQKALDHEKAAHDKKGIRKQDITLGPDGKPLGNYAGFNERYSKRKMATIPGRVQGIHRNRGLGMEDTKYENGGGWDERGNCLGCGLPKSKHKSNETNNLNNGRTAEYTPCNPKGKNPGDVFFINPRPFPEAHFATFPIDLPEKIIKCGSPENGIVLDPFFGSGTVGLAAERLNRKWIGIELNEEYIRLARKRLEPFMSTKLDGFT